MILFVVSLAVGASPVDARLTAALQLEQEGQGAEALRRLEALVQTDPTSELARLEAARLGLKVGVAVEQALLHAEIARSLAPENPRAHYLCALALDEVGDRQGAIAALQVALTLRSDYPDARFRLAGLLSAQRRWPEAVAGWRAVLERSPTAHGARQQLALALEASGALQAAEAELEALTHVDVARVPAIRALVGLLERSGRHAKAATWRRALEPPARALRPLKASTR
ncbi:MAG: hypothetical protein INH41_09685 [Myxococcaceae bacterium]|nr:hypothetical protein [Myxococcaceae bacterium]MCA3012655.1 hypothetical protein [Myxococcaceae bacterium]